MEEKQVKLFYEEMKNTFVKPNSDWGDKAKTLRTLLEKFFQNLTPELDSQTTLGKGWLHIMMPIQMRTL